MLECELEPGLIVWRVRVCDKSERAWWPAIVYTRVGANSEVSGLKSGETEKAGVPSSVIPVCVRRMAQTTQQPQFKVFPRVNPKVDRNGAMEVWSESQVSEF
jgi:hypothetical protein